LTDVEYAFSCGGLIVSKIYYSLSNQLVQAATVISSWISLSALIPEDEIMKAFNEKSK
jgi:hypothetical protein